MFKKNMKKGLSVLLSLAMVVTSVTVSGKTAAAEEEAAQAWATTTEISVVGGQYVVTDSFEDTEIKISGTITVADEGVVDTENDKVFYQVFVEKDGYSTPGELRDAEDPESIVPGTGGKGVIDIEGDAENGYTYTKTLSIADWTPVDGNYFVDVYFQQPDDEGNLQNVSNKEGASFVVYSPAKWDIALNGDKAVPFGTEKTTVDGTFMKYTKTGLTGYTGEITAETETEGITFDAIEAEDGEFTVGINIADTVEQDTAATVTLTADGAETEFGVYVCPEKAYRITDGAWGHEGTSTGDYYLDKTKDNEFSIEKENYFAKLFADGELKDAAASVFGNDYFAFYDVNNESATLTPVEFKEIVKNVKATIDFADENLEDVVITDGTYEYNPNTDDCTDETKVEVSKWQLTMFNPWNDKLGLVAYRGEAEYSAPTAEALGLSEAQIAGLETATLVYSFDVAKTEDADGGNGGNGGNGNEENKDDNKKEEVKETARTATVTAIGMNPNVITTTVGAVTTAAAVLTATGTSLDMLATKDIKVEAVSTSGITVALATKAAVTSKAAAATFEAIVTVPAKCATGEYAIVASTATIKATVATVKVIEAAASQEPTVEPVKTTKLTIKTANGTNKLTMGVGETAKIAVKKKPAASEDAVTAASSKAKVVKAKVNAAGKLILKAKKVGKAKVTVTSGDVSKKITVTVMKAPKKLALKDGKKAAKKTVKLAANTKKKAVKKSYKIVLPKKSASYAYTIKKTDKKKVVKSAVVKTNKKGVQTLVVTVKKKAKGNAKIVITSAANKKAKATVKVVAK